MDKDLDQLLTAASESAGGASSESSLVVPDPFNGEVEVKVGGETRRHPLKPLRDLFDTGTGATTVDPQSPQFMPLLLAIEEATLSHQATDPSLTDGRVSLVLDQLSMDPASPASDALSQMIQLRLRLALSIGNYSRNDVKMAVRKIAKSVQRHTRDGGPRGYLQFIASMLQR